jgi:hypothetical protein
MADNSKEDVWRRSHAVDPRLLMAGLFVVAMMPLMVTPVLPLIDFYDHVARFYVLAHVGSSALLQDHYAAHWVLMPDIGTDILSTPLLRFVPPLVAGHIIAIAIMAILYGGVLYFHKALTGRHSLLMAVLLLPLLYSYIFNWGFANFLLSLGFAFWAAGWWLSYRHRPLFAVPVSCLLSILIFLSHGMAFAMYGIMTAMLEVGFFFNAPVRRFSDLVRALSLLAIQAIIPVVLFVVWYLHQAPGEVVTLSAGLSQQALADARPIFRGFHRLSSILRVEEGPAFWFDATTFVIQIVAVLFLIRRGQVAIARPAWLLIAVATSFIILTPAAMFGVWYIADRMPLFAALCLLGAMSLRPGSWKPDARLAGGILVATVFLRLIAVTASWQQYASDYREFTSVATKIPRGSLTMGVMVGAGHHETEVPRCEMYSSLLIAQYNQIGPLFSFQGQHPLLITGALQVATERLERTEPVPYANATNYGPYMTAAGAAGFEYLLVCNAHLLTHPFPEGLELMARTPRFALFHARH